MALTEERRGQSGPILSDGTPFSDLIDLDRREVSLRVLSDPEIYELEQRHLWGKAWVFIAHVSEVPNAGDYVTRYIGEDAVIVVRDNDGDVQVLLNVCTHRGMAVCRYQQGSTERFKCPYHGWVFGREGEFLAAPWEQEMYGDVLEKDRLGLQKAKVEVFAGLVFANWDHHAAPLSDYLGDFAWYLRSMLDRTDSGLEVVGAPQRYSLQANWKTPGEQFAGDGYHTASLHRFMAEVGYVRDNFAGVMFGVDVSANGHGLRCQRYVYSEEGEQLKAQRLDPRTMLQEHAIPGLAPELVPQVFDKYDDRGLRLLAEAPPTVGGIFPNVGLLIYTLPAPNGGVGSVSGIRTFVPHGVDNFEFMHWTLTEKDAPKQWKDATRGLTTYAIGASGVFEQDDSEAWPSIQRATRGWQGRNHSFKYQALLGDHKPDDWPGDGHVYEGFSKDDNQWNWWLRYREMMLAGGRDGR